MRKAGTGSKMKQKYKKCCYTKKSVAALLLCIVFGMKQIFQ